MVDRVFSETDLRTMMEAATGFRLTMTPGRYLIDTKHQSKSWIVVVEPDWDERTLVVVTAYPREPG